MPLTPPYLLAGAAGSSLGISGLTLDALNIQDATLTQASLAPDTLVFSLRAKAGGIIPDDSQWITLRDSTGAILFTGITKRSFAYPAKIYRYTATNVYQGLADTTLTDASGKPYLLYPTGNLWDIIADILTRAQAAGLPIQPPAAADMPAPYTVPKMSFRSATFASALEDALKWAPDAVTRMDYSTSPPTLRIVCRGAASQATLQLDSDNHHATTVDLTPYPEARALGITLSYGRRDGAAAIIQMTQSAGDLTAEAHRKLSLYLSGIERSDLLLSEAVSTAQTAIAMATALGAVAASATTLPLSWATCVERDSQLQAATVAEPGFTMHAGGLSVRLYSSCSWTGGGGYASNIVSESGLYLAEATGYAATGWYAVPSDAFTAEQLTTAGATQATKYIRGSLVYGRLSGESSAGLNAIATYCHQHSGWLSDTAASSDAAAALYRDFRVYAVNLSVDAVNKAPSAIKAAVDAAAQATASLVTRAEFVEAPPDLAAHYFARQDWTPYKGTIGLSPSVPYLPVPGDFVSVRALDAPTDWASMMAPLASTEIDLRTGAATLTLGPSPRMDYSSISDRLRIQIEDNYQPG